MKKDNHGHWINRRDFIKAAGIGAAGLAAGRSFASSLNANERPNVLLIIVDQMRMPCWFPEDARLPAFERLRKEGLTFANHFTSAVPCSPSRASLFTGLHMPQHGMNQNVSAEAYGIPLSGNNSLDF